MYLKEKTKTEIINKAQDIKRIATLETCGIKELTDLYHHNNKVRLWFKSWIEEQANDIEKLLTDN